MQHGAPELAQSNLSVCCTCCQCMTRQALRSGAAGHCTAVAGGGTAVARGGVEGPGEGVEDEGVQGCVQVKQTSAYCSMVDQNLLKATCQCEGGGEMEPRETGKRVRRCRNGGRPIKQTSAYAPYQWVLQYDLPWQRLRRPQGSFLHGPLLLCPQLRSQSVLPRLPEALLHTFTSAFIYLAS